MEDLKARLSMAENWVASYAPQSLKFQISASAPSYRPSSDAERRFIEAIISMLERDMKEADIQNEVFNTARSLNLEMGKAFAAVYRTLLGSERGPRLAPLLMALDREWAISRLRSSSEPSPPEHAGSKLCGFLRKHNNIIRTNTS
jgi:lysyl-tRNA synthetase class 1